MSVSFIARLANWLREEQYADMIRQLFDSPEARLFFDAGELARLLGVVIRDAAPDAGGAGG